MFGASPAGAAPGGFNFGAPAAAAPAAAPAGGFGGFGAAAPAATNAFGAAPAAGGFGAAPSATGGFGATPSFGAAPAAGGFGASTPGGFGAAPSTGFGGTPSAAPQGFGAGAAPSTPSGFGGSGGASSTPAGFGGAFGTTTPSLGAGGFGAASTPGTFGGVRPAQPTFGGAAPGTPSLSFGGGGFGTPQGSQFALSQTSAPGMSAQPSFGQMGAMPGMAAPPIPDDSISAMELMQFDPSSIKRRLCYIFYNVREPGVQYAEPPMDSALRDSDNPDPARLYPVMASGFEDLKKRVEMQSQQSKRHLEGLRKIEEKIAQLASDHDLKTTIMLKAYRDAHQTLLQRLIRVIRLIEVQRNRGYPLQPDEESLRVKMETLRQELSKPAVFDSRLGELRAFIRAQKGMGGRQTDEYDITDEGVLNAISSALAKHQQGIKFLVETLKEDTEDLDVSETAMAQVRA